MLVDQARDGVGMAIGKDTHASDRQDAVVLFTSGWSHYQKVLGQLTTPPLNSSTVTSCLVPAAVLIKIVENDHLRHSVLYAAVVRDMAERWAGNAVSLLDLGCGDARVIASTLHGTGLIRSLHQYTGVDLCEEALVVARDNLAAATTSAATECSCNLVHEDMMTFACGSAEPVFDVALASFAAHHLTTSEEKRRFLTGVRRHLRPGATLYVVDVFRKDGEERAGFMRRFLPFCRDTWISLSTAELDKNDEHVVAYDFPEDFITYERIASEAGFSAADKLAVDNSELMAALALRT